MMKRILIIIGFFVGIQGLHSQTLGSKIEGTLINQAANREEEYHAGTFFFISSINNSNFKMSRFLQLKIQKALPLHSVILTLSTL